MTTGQFWVFLGCFTYENERATGIEPAWPAWKAGTLPLSYARAIQEENSESFRE
jgi:hypothetical protein